jgi:hypothetical protein
MTFPVGIPASRLLLAALALLAAAPGDPGGLVGTLPGRRRPEGEVAFEARDAATGDLIPCKLTFVEIGRAPSPSFTRGKIARAEGDGTIAVFDRVMSVPGRGVVHAPYGNYDVTVSRGPEWDVATIGVHVGPQRASLSAELIHVVDTKGWLSGDFHVHAAPSPDSSTPMAHRIIEFVSEGVEMIVSTDHNVLSDYQPAIEALGAGRLIASSIGDEMTIAGWGHFGAFPLPRGLDGAGLGEVLLRGRSAGEIFRGVRGNAPGAVLNAFHPRIDDEIGYFNVGQLDTRGDRASRAGFSFDFDAMEVLNGYEYPVRSSVDRNIEDWLRLLDRGHIVTATGSSDTHHLTTNFGGYPRNYVRVRDDHPDRVAPAEIAQAVKDHHCFLTTGPFLQVTAGPGGIGDVVPARRGRADVDIEVRAPPWMSVDRVIAYVDGRVFRRWTVRASTAVVRFRERLSLTLAADGYVVVRVDGDRLMAPVVGNTRRFAVRPLALANPIFFDVDGNGRYDPLLPHGPHTPLDAVPLVFPGDRRPLRRR